MEVDRTITAEEFGELISEYEPFDTRAVFDADGITLDLKEYDVRVLMRSVREDPEVTVNRSTNEGMATMSQLLLEIDGETLEVENDGTFDLEIPGLGNVLDE